jgi:hypothetical protein
MSFIQCDDRFGTKFREEPKYQRGLVELCGMEYKKETANFSTRL